MRRHFVVIIKIYGCYSCQTKWWLLIVFFCIISSEVVRCKMPKFKSVKSDQKITANRIEYYLNKTDSVKALKKLPADLEKPCIGGNWLSCCWKWSLVLIFFFHFYSCYCVCSEGRQKWEREWFSYERSKSGLR